MPVVFSVDLSSGGAPQPLSIPRPMITTDGTGTEWKEAEKAREGASNLDRGDREENNQAARRRLAPFARLIFPVYHGKPVQERPRHPQVARSVAFPEIAGPFFSEQEGGPPVGPLDIGFRFLHVYRRCLFKSRVRCDFDTIQPKPDRNGRNGGSVVCVRQELPKDQS